MAELCVRYELTPQDVAALSAALNRPARGARNWGRHERLRLMLAGAALLGLAFCLIKLYVHRETGLDLPGWDAGLAFLGAGIGGGWLIASAKPAPMAADDPRLGERWLTVGPDGFVLEGFGFRNAIDWTAVTAIDTVADFLVLRTIWQDLHVVPRRAFDSPDEARIFEQTAGIFRLAAIDQVAAAAVDTNEP